MRAEDLDVRQRKVVEAVMRQPATVLVLGGPGTGKTTAALWAARSYLEAAGEKTAPRVLFLTFSRSAVAQISSRSPGVLSNLGDRVELLTFHGLAYRLLRAFGRYAGYGTKSLVIQSEARTKLLGHDGSRLRYSDLIGGAIRILESSERIRDLVRKRWGLVICDEVQDTSTEQWRFLQLVAAEKLLLLGDANQMIYSSFVPGVSKEQFRQISEKAERTIALLPRSHRDPSGAIPALAEAVRVRDFGNAAVIDALATGRLTVHANVTDEARAGLLMREIARARELGSRDIGLFAHSNAAVAGLADLLNREGVDHALIGISEAHAEGLGAMATECAFAIGLATRAQVRESLALFLTAAARGREVPPLAQALIGRAPLPGLVQDRLMELEQALLDTRSEMLVDVAEVAMRSWEGLGIAAGYRPWHRAAQHFRRLIAPVKGQQTTEQSVESLLRVVEQSRVEALIDLDYSEYGEVKLMNYHQTKGREADTVVHVFLSQDYFGRESEPFEEASRLLNVAISRARKRVVILLPPDPHPLVAPFELLPRSE